MIKTSLSYAKKWRMISFLWLIVTLFFTSVVTLPTAALADDPYQFKSEGLLGCTTNVGQSVGAQAAVGGVYVPVNDAAVTINTGLTVYKLCVLDPLTRKIAENAVAGLASQALRTLNNGTDNSGPLYATKQASQAPVSYVDSDALKALQALQKSKIKNNDEIVQTVAKKYTDVSTWDKELSSLQCPDNTNNYWDDFIKNMGDPRCNNKMFTAALYENEYFIPRIAQCRSDYDAQLAQGRGFLPITSSKDCGSTIVTPAAYVEENGLSALQSGMRQAELSQTMGTVPSALVAGLANAAMSSGGLTGISQPTGNQPSYLSQMTAEAASQVRQNASNAALQVLVNARNVEAQYFQLMNLIASTLTQTISNLRSAEQQCFAKIIERVCTSAPVNGKCTDAEGDSLTIATSSAFSQAVITNSVTPLATPAVNNINASQSALRLMDQMISGLTNTTSLDAQRLALQQLDTLVAQHKLHSSTDISSAKQQQQAVTDSMTQLVQDTVKAWADSTDPNVGWCNYNNAATLALWKQRWK